MKKFSETLIEHTLKIINFEKKKMIPLTNEQKESYEKAKTYYICKNSSNINKLMIKIFVNLKAIFIILINAEVLHIAYTKPK